MIPEILGFEQVWPYYLAALVVGFAIGSLPVGILIAKALGLPDPRSQGSGNVGASNLARVGGAKVGVATLALDALKGYAPAAIAWSFYGPMMAGAAGLGALLGHCYTPWLRFRGGKGVATGFGALLAFRWEIGVLCALVWLAVALLTRISSAGSLATAVAALALFAYFEEWDYAPFVLIMAVVLVVRHAGNIRRLLRGEENRLSFGGRSG